VKGVVDIEMSKRGHPTIFVKFIQSKREEDLLAALLLSCLTGGEVHCVDIRYGSVKMVRSTMADRCLKEAIQSKVLTGEGNIGDVLFVQRNHV
jgi:hypothetical protein